MFSKDGSCGSDSFKCASPNDGYECIAAELQCNGYVNCYDESDEKDCMKLPDHTGFHDHYQSGQF